MSVRTLLEGTLRQVAAILLPVFVIILFGHFLGSPELYDGNWDPFGGERIFYVLAAAAFGVFVGTIAGHSAYPFPVSVAAFVVAGGLFFMAAPGTVGEWLMGRRGELIEWTLGLVLTPAYLLGAFRVHQRLRKKALKREYEEKAAQREWERKVAEMQGRSPDEEPASAEG